MAGLLPRLVPVSHYNQRSAVVDVIVLRILLLLPLAGALLIAFLPTRSATLVRRVALGVAAATLGWAVWLAHAFDPAAAGGQVFETHLWNPRLGSAFSLGGDGISLPLVWLATLLAFIAGVAYILSFMDGVASIDKIQIIEDDTIQGMYVMVQQVNWWAAIAWAVFVLALLSRRAWALPLGVGAALMACLGGYPIAVESTLDKGTFSMFAPAPLLSTALLVYLLLPGTRAWLERWARGEDAPAPSESVSRPAYAGQ